ncbi:MAG: c-type cytochrome, partial [Saprospiraceae bacterium]|nr:c-type cytochrome [Saprospiraceae bacterium]
MMLKRICWVFTFLFAAVLTMQAQPTKEAGKELFVANCASCHNKNMKDNLTGPALGGLEERWAAYPRKDLYTWIRNSQSMIAAGHPRAAELWAKWKPVAMNNFPGLTDEQMESMILYINDQYTNGNKPPVVVNGTESTSETSDTPWVFVGLATILGFLAFALMRIVNNLYNVTRVQSGQNPINKTTAQILSTKGAIAFMVFALVLIFGHKMVDNATSMGRTQGYEPDQPVAFSHKLHAGTNKIDCQYCHDSARRSKH